MSAGCGGAVRRLIVLGSTGSIGTNTLDVVRHLHAATDRRFDVVGLAAGANVDGLLAQATEFGVGNLALAVPGEGAGVHPAACGSKIEHVGPDAALHLIEAIGRPGDLVVAAVVGAAGIPAVLAAIERGCDIALANKETLVAAGALVMPLVRERGVALLPVDSEHSAVFQCLQAGRSIDEVRRVVLTASGGPFRTHDHGELERVTVEEALNHPTWSMGRKVTIDSATMMNKALEVIEAHWLFGVGADRIEAIVHPQSIVHGFVEFDDGAVLAQLGPPDMRTPIQVALTWPDRLSASGPALDWKALHGLDFEPVDHARFGAIELAFDVVRRGGTAGAIFNAANEVAVEAFLAGRIPFTRITTLVATALQQLPAATVTDMQSVLDADCAARAVVEEHIGNNDAAVASGR